MHQRLGFRLRLHQRRRDIWPGGGADVGKVYIDESELSISRRFKMSVAEHFTLAGNRTYLRRQANEKLCGVRPWHVRRSPENALRVRLSASQLEGIAAALYRNQHRHEYTGGGTGSNAARVGILSSAS